LRNVLNVGLPAVELLDFSRVGIESGDAMPSLGKSQPQWESHLSAANNSDAELRAFEKFRLTIGRHRCLFQLLKNFHDCCPRADYNNFLIDAIPARRASVLNRQSRTVMIRMAVSNLKVWRCVFDSTGGLDRRAGARQICSANWKREISRFSRKY